MDQFKLSITFGNDAMQDTYDVAEVLERVAEALANGAVHGAIWDANGNKVGQYAVFTED